MAGERADLLMGQGWQGTRWRMVSAVPRPGPPLPGLVGPAEEDDRERAGGGRQVGRPGIVGP